MLRPALFSLVTLLVLLSGCTGTRIFPAPAKQQSDLATLVGMPEDARIRFWGDLDSEVAERQLRRIGEQISARIAAEGEVPNNGRYDVLALSGGGADGAFGAGLLNGWSDMESRRKTPARPEFSLVTGISVGALIAPFAFLGSGWDDELERLFTTTSTADLITYNFFNALFGYSLGLTDIQRLEDTLAKLVDDNMVKRIAEEHRKGRRLWIGTTYLDAERPVIWDIGEIAVSGYAYKPRLIQKVLLASSAIPGAFPPVEFAIEIGGRVFSEMHVDGSVTRQLFAFPGNVPLGDLVRKEVPSMEPGTIYLVRNSKLTPDFMPVEPSLRGILSRSLFTLTNALAIGDVANIEKRAEAEGWRLLSSAVPPEFSFPSDDFFDPRYMNALFEVGYDRAVDGIAWEILHNPEGTPRPLLAEAG